MCITSQILLLEACIHMPVYDDSGRPVGTIKHLLDLPAQLNICWIVHVYTQYRPHQSIIPCAHIIITNREAS